MIFKGIKAKSVRKAIEKSLQTPSKIKPTYPESIGFIVDIDRFSKTNELFALADSLNIKAKNVEVISYSRTIKVADNYAGKMLNDNQVGWKGDFKSDAVNSFVNTPFDMLINYYDEEIAAMLLVTAQSKANFKVGFPQIDERLNDFTIATPLEEIDVFGKELKKYLNIFYQNA